jgi:hypothetical protein
MPQKMVVRIALLAAAFGLAAAGVVAQGKHWPEVRPRRQSVKITSSPLAADFRILGKDGTPLYRIECHNSEYVDRDFIYSGDFECRLTALYEDFTYPTLFTDDPHTTRDWQSRARFLSQELVGKCFNYPEFGAVRHFRLRGMRITLAMGEIVFSSTLQRGSPDLRAFRFDVVVERDAGARSAITEPVAYGYPPWLHPGSDDDRTLDCSHVRTADRQEAIPGRSIRKGRRSTATPATNVHMPRPRTH